MAPGTVPRVAALGLVLALAGAPALAAPVGAPVGGSERLLPPVSPACVSSPFGPRILPGRPQAGTYHYGIDLPAPLGAPVRAAAAGLVLRIERHGPGGLEMLVQHPGFVAVYSHFGTIAPVFAEGGRVVAAGERLGVVGLSGVTFGPHLYFGMFVGGQPVDPAPYLNLPLCASGEHVTVAGRSVLSKDGKILPSRAFSGPIPPSQGLGTTVRRASVRLR